MTGNVLRSYSVIVPVLNRANELAATLDSIAASMAFFEANHPRSHEITGEIVVVDEGSTDGGQNIVRDVARRDGRVRLVQHDRSYGIGPARNTGVRMSAGDVLFFCDGDDLFLPEHIFVGFSLLDRSANADDRAAEDIRLRIGERGHLLFSPERPVAAVRTGVRLKDAVLPEWMIAIQETITQCLCVRRECHDWIEGFPDEAVYKRIGGSEDAAYGIALHLFFRVGVIDLETVEYVRRPGNSLDQQMRRFTHPPGSPFDMAAPEHKPLYAIRARLEDEKIGYLLDKWQVLGQPPLPAAMLNWPLVVSELMRRQQVRPALAVAAQAAQMGHAVPVELTDELETQIRTGP
jgi:glycosyltransferase involved in cell wall biosynthesis